jgi:ADP-ribose pyrophosphatase YjhB (NUDIX family)
MKTLLRITPNISWMPENSESRLYHTDELPEAEIRRTVFVFAEERMLLTRLAKRSWDIPGGHTELGESPAEAAARETMEEASVVVEGLELLGVQELEMFGALPHGGWTRPFSAQIFYLCRVEKMLPFLPTDEASDRGLFSPAAVRAILP